MELLRFRELPPLPCNDDPLMSNEGEVIGNSIKVSSFGDANGVIGFFVTPLIMIFGCCCLVMSLEESDLPKTLRFLSLFVNFQRNPA
ncbi:hypothetical protein WICPIJ_003416 [Wickerhamomyces pijperi]|uniref:Uncharacterized protein n=1 Tax=Wickerhamomyces pijperi TaxID=599730 RepID=A0A9P8Q7Z4_WICPI|nr:hypothetical protein WICPIJ_003416 [Wickerhamomyces pijperi]